MKEASHKHWIGPDLETRIVALVLGEASDLERDQLMRLIEERPELATLKEQFDAVHQLLRDVGAGELPAADDDWQLSAERRNALLALICGDAKERPVQKVFSRAVMERSARIAPGRSLPNALSHRSQVFCSPRPRN